MSTSVAFKVNGTTYRRDVSAGDTLLDVLRDGLALTGTKEGCGNGNCGTCTVLLDGAPVNACLVLAPEIAGADIVTIEGLSDGRELHPIQQALVETGGTQCGFCTPGIVLSAKALLESNPAPSDHEIRQAIAGNLCRCTGYGKIVEAIAVAAERMRSVGT